MEGDIMKQFHLACIRLAVSVPMLVGVASAFAQEAKQSVGKVSVESTSIAAGIGVTWGDGTLEFQGKTYKFSVSGLSIVDVGISKASVSGEVYDLTKVEDFPGTYVAASIGFALAGGVGGTATKNQNGVVVNLRSVTQGLQLKLAPQGFTIKMK
jgi:hypothetical protein